MASASNGNITTEFFGCLNGCSLRIDIRERELVSPLFARVLNAWAGALVLSRTLGGEAAFGWSCQRFAGIQRRNRGRKIKKNLIAQQFQRNDL